MATAKSDIPHEQAPEPAAPDYEKRYAHLGDPGYAIGLAGFISSFFVSVVGIVLSAIGLHQSKSVNRGNKFALAGLIIGIVRFVLDVAAIGLFVFGIAALAHHCQMNPDQCRNSDYNGNYYYQRDPSYDPSTDGGASTQDRTF